MAYKKGSMSLEQLRKEFGADVIDDNGSYSKSKGGDSLAGNKQLRNYFINELGRSESDWDDGHKTPNDINTAIRSLYDGGSETTTTTPTERPEFAHSPRVAHAKARLAQHKEDVLSGKTGTDLFGDTASQDAADSFLERYKLKLGKQDANGNYFEYKE